MNATKELDFKDLITYEEAAKALRLSTETIRNWVRQGKIKKYPLTYRTVFLSKKELKEFILSKEE
ncbi:helix-turn-helix domain-containing protein [Campylobacter ureolyticus]|jgi:DNA binding domain, excisionase family|uniref:Helix-turn-helix domain-containing protein n=1 Tax=Campylobacter ureolyticus TaxID=827 RepID=A0A9Q4KPT9_9BACT|nr:helix-turn-helix domain-containing protein [Campylobacter ureolyticus]MCZ6161982.1 helix-turn-helix domain-containing protein [Campylobacter ureolyticus]MCZ6170942.1 helix-turn-helix domain-containing protein [Campylobacter ureolyticus]